MSNFQSNLFYRNFVYKCFNISNDIPHTMEECYDMVQKVEQNKCFKRDSHITS